MKQPELKEYRESIENGATLEQLNPEMRMTVITHRYEWERQSMKEWRRDPKKFELSVEKDFGGEAQRCDLCGTRLPKSVFHVVNHKNGLNLHIGGDCVENVMNLEPEIGSSLTDAEYKRQQEFLGLYPQIVEFLHNSPSDVAPFEVSSGIIKQETSLRKKGNALRTQFVRKSNKKYAELNALCQDIKRLQQSIDLDVADKSNANGLSIYLRRQLEIDQNKQVKNIRRYVQEKNGFLKTDAAILIQDHSFLEDYQKMVISQNNSEKTGIANVVLVSHGVFAVDFICKIAHARFVFDSEDVISAFKYPVGSFTKQAVKNLLVRSESRKLDKTAEHAIHKLGISYFESKGLQEARIDFQSFTNFVQKHEQRLIDDDKSHVTPGRFNKLLKSVTILSNHGRYAVYSRDEVKQIGEEYFISCFVGNPSPSVTVTVSSLDDTLTFLYHQYDAHYSHASS